MTFRLRNLPDLKEMLPKARVKLYEDNNLLDNLWSIEKNNTHMVLYDPDAVMIPFLKELNYKETKTLNDLASTHNKKEDKLLLDIYF